MKSINQKRSDLLGLLRGEISVESINMAGIASLHIIGSIAEPHYWIDSQQVSQQEFERYEALLKKHRFLMTIDWSRKDYYDRGTYVSDKKT